MTVFGLLRDLLNPLAAPPPTGGGPSIGTYVAIDRAVAGARAGTSRRLGTGATAPRLSAGLDLQRMRDDRTNERHDAGVRLGDFFLDQVETVTELGPFAQLQWSPVEPLLVSGGARYDWVRFALDDRYLGDGFDDSDARTMSAVSGNIGASWAFSEGFVPYANISTAFETPTTTELVNQPDGSGGFNTELGPQRAVNYEIGARGQPVPQVTYSVALFLGRVTDAIVQQEEVGGRAFFRNEGKTHNDGAELGLAVTPVTGLTLNAAYTYARYRFEGGTFDGNRLPGVPVHRVTGELRLRPVDRLSAYVGAQWQSRAYVDNANTDAGEIHVRGFGPTPTVTAVPFRAVDPYALVHVGARWTAGPVTLQASVENLFDKTYAGNVATNAADGRFYSAGAGRYLSVGMSVAAQGGAR